MAVLWLIFNFFNVSDQPCYFVSVWFLVGEGRLCDCLFLRTSEPLVITTSKSFWCHESAAVQMFLSKFGLPTTQPVWCIDLQKLLQLSMNLTNEVLWNRPLEVWVTWPTLRFVGLPCVSVMMISRDFVQVWRISIFFALDGNEFLVQYEKFSAGGGSAWLQYEI
jgi:hypothetical protein